MGDSLFKYDYYRYFGNRKSNFFRRIFMHYPVELMFLRAFRKAQYYRGKKRFLLQYLYWELKKRRLSTKTHIQIPTVTQIGKGFYIGHFGRVIVNPRAVLGNNITINTGVTIGQTNRG